MSIFSSSSNLSSLRAPSRVVTDDGADASFQHCIDSQLQCWCDGNSFHRPQSDGDGTVSKFINISRGHIMGHETAYFIPL
jgi:hypothetical protein